MWTTYMWTSGMLTCGILTSQRQVKSGKNVDKGGDK